MDKSAQEEKLEELDKKLKGCDKKVILIWLNYLKFLFF